MKEIGIRKILGSGEWRIIYLLTGDFTKMVMTAIVMALPVSYFLTKFWLDNFSEHVQIEWWFFAGAGLIALLIAWFTVSLQIIKVARINPVKSLKSE